MVVSSVPAGGFVGQWCAGLVCVCVDLNGFECWGFHTGSDLGEGGLGLGVGFIWAWHGTDSQAAVGRV